MNSINQTVNLPVGASITYTVTGALNGTVAGTVVNTATVTVPAGTTDINVGNNTAVDIDAVGITASTADLSITKTNGVTTAAAGNPLSYTIVVANNGPSAVIGATVADLFPATLTGPIITATDTGGASGFVNGSGNLAQIVNLPVGATITYNVNATVSGTAAGTVSNTATVTAPVGITDMNQVNHVATDVDVVAATTATADLSIVKSDGVSAVAPGQAATYTIVVSNNGSTAVTGATVTDVFSSLFSSVNFTAASVGGAAGATSGTGNINQTVNLPIGSSITYTVTGTVAGTASGSITNTAAVATPLGVLDVNAANNVSIDTDLVVAAIPQNSVDLSITKSDGALTATPGGTLTYTVVVANAGPSAANGVIVSDVFPANFTGVTFAATGTGAASGFLSGSGNINQTVNLPGGTSITYTVTGTVSASATGAIANTATVTAPSNVTDTNTLNNVATDIDTLVATADLSITKTDNVTSVAAGGSLTYTIVVNNAGPTAVTGATISDIIPTALTNVNFTASGTGGASGFVSDSGNINQTVNLPAGVSITYLVTAAVLSTTVPGTLVNTATVTAPAGVIDSNLTNNTATDTDSVVSGVESTTDLSVIKTVDQQTVAAGDNLTYTITVSNIGNFAAQNITLTDAIPANTTFVSATETSGSAFTLTTPLRSPATDLMISWSPARPPLTRTMSLCKPFWMNGHRVIAMKTGLATFAMAVAPTAGSCLTIRPSSTMVLAIH